ncbi:protein kinase domain-containing protein [Cryptosporangium arvum]|uniref:non-specific serine/threonine protein kinase n=1 Tax=Cryptosporangium arvum DSM 44712 TaxID=927661 RepID=A0A010ZPA2_9ACTN|nr:protein kinase [Cryptosporangium arvum]EXG79057.1 serine/threonine protein kinase [Cryptosporangium arvum DSM 44712]
MTSRDAGPRLGDRYVLREVLGRGATGAVWAAHDIHLDRPVAVKVLIDAGDTLTTPERFQREARTTARLNHANIVAVYDVGRISEHDSIDAAPGTPFLVMELLTGGSWKDALSGPLPRPEKVAGALAGVARALAAAHAVGVTHRDIKPANVLLNADGEAKLADFGIAKSTESTGLTRPGDIVGTLAYTAPECLEGQAAGPAADVWSFGVMLYESLAGHRPFEQETLGALITAIQSGRYRSLAYDLPSLPHALSATVDRCLDPDPPHRPTAAELARVLSDAVATTTTTGSAPPTTITPVSGPPSFDPTTDAPAAWMPISSPPVSGPPSSGPPVSGPPVSGPPVSGPPVSGPPSGWRVAGPPPAPPTSGQRTGPTARVPSAPGSPVPIPGPYSGTRRATGGGVPPVNPPVPVAPHEEPRKRRRWVLPVAAGVVLVLLTGGAFAGRSLFHAVAGCSGELPLVVASSPEKAGVVTALAERYNADPDDVDGTCVRVQIVIAKSGEAVEALAKGWPTADYGVRPDVWTPASSVWVGLLGQKAGAIGAMAKAPSLARSPLVIAAPEATAKAMGWPAKSPSWQEIARYAGNDAEWKRVSKSETPFLFARTNPLVSTSGLHATLAAYLAAPGRTGDVEEDLQRSSVRLFLRTLERSTDRYGDTTLTFLETLRQQAEQSGTSSVSALAVEEQTVWAYNQGEPMSAGSSHLPAPAEKLVAMQPSDGTLVSDHPYVTVDSVIDAPWVTPAKRAAADDFQKFLLEDEQQAAFRAAGFRDSNDKLDPDVVAKSGGFIAERPATTFPSPQPAAVAALLNAWRDLNRPANVLIVLDTSGSMKEKVAGTKSTRLQLATQAAEASLDYFGTNDRVGLWEFSTKLDGPVDHRQLVPISSKNEGALKRALQSLTPKNDTGLYDTARDAVQLVRAQSDADGINAVVLLTDGDNQDPGSISPQALLAGLKAEPTVRVYPVAFGDELTRDGKNVLNQVAKTTGGRYYESNDPRRIESVLGDVMSNF